MAEAFAFQQTTEAEPNMANLPQKLERAEQLAARHAKLTRIAQERDKVLMKYLEDLRRIGVQLSKMPQDEAEALLRERYGEGVQYGFSDVIAHQYPDLPPKYRWKYAKTVQLAFNAKQPVKAFKAEKGGLNGCVAKKKKKSAAKRTGSRTVVSNARRQK
ncbi:MAG: hypothetical protein ACJ8F3_00200 [Xanthobacteraceae bacterium]